MQIRIRTLLVTLLVGLAGSAFLIVNTAWADAVQKSPFEQKLLRNLPKLRTSAGSDPETVWVGHVKTNTGYPGTAGGSGPFKIGRGDNLVVGGRLGTDAAYNGVWDFDRLAGSTDSLMGWWPIQCPFGSVGPTDFDDDIRPWFSLDYGNQGNYSPRQGRTFGVLGYWHADGGSGQAADPDNAAHNPVAPSWAPIAGSKSAWCGLRAHGDVAVTDPITGNGINSTLMSFQGNPVIQTNPQRTQGTDQNFPGYGGQWDQMLYRDISFAANASGNVTIQFSYATSMSLGFDNGHASQAGWFDKDPLKNVVLGDGNYRSVNAGALVDSFMVYIGAPVDDANCTYSDGSVLPVYDSQRRWFSEVVKINTPGTTYRQLLSVAGANGTTAAPIAFNQAIAQSTINAILDADGGASNGGRVRLVFRVKTNRGFDDQDNGQNGFSSGSAGAAIIDGVSVSGGGAAALSSGFENAGDIDNEIHFFPIVCATTDASATVTSAGLFGSVLPGSSVSGAGIPANTIVTAKTDASTITISNAATATGNPTLTFDDGPMASSAWKSTGKPPGAWFHLHDINEPGALLPFDDPCGEPEAPVRFCNMYGKVASPGNHELADKTGGVFGSPTQDQQKYFVSPTINLVSVGGSNDVLTGTGVGVYNGQGIDEEIAQRVPQLWGDQLFNVYNFPTTGNGFRYAWQSYPATQPNGVKTWGEHRKTIFFNFVTNPGCFGGSNLGPIATPKDDQLVVTTNASGVPDSFRVYIESMSRCYSTPLTASQCSPDAGSSAGGYYDNLSVALIAAPPPPALAANIWDLFNDCFPVNSQNKPVSTFGVGYDTLAARIQTGYNNAPQTSADLTGPNARECIAGDSAFVGANGDDVRMDLVFRVLPGVGNYVTIGSRGSGVAQRPDVSPRIAASAADAANGALPAVAKFFGAYLADNGTFGTPGGHAGGVWDPNVWNSARMDTVETGDPNGDTYGGNIFPVRSAQFRLGGFLHPRYMSMYHESDPKYTILGIAKNRCFVQDTTGNPNQTPINCGALGGANEYPPDIYVDGAPNSGYNPNEIAGQPGKTYEYTKILPDGQFTPGAQIQYFFRKSLTTDPATVFELAPDTNFIFPQGAEGGYFDFHRWREVSVLPDRWKDPGFGEGGTGMACMLVLDLGDRRGDEAIWKAVADSIGLTATPKKGAHDGWRARSDQPILGVDVGSDTSPDSPARRDNGGQAGSLWDLFETVAGESNVPSGRPGSRGASRNTTGGSFTAGHWSTHGPSGDMAKNYRLLVLLASDIGDESIGPIPNQTDNDIGLYQSFLTLPGGSEQPRGMIAMGYRLGEGAEAFANISTFWTTFFRATLRDGDYRLNLSGNTDDVADLIVAPPVAAGSGFSIVAANQCFLNLDVYDVEVAAPAGQASVLYENTGSNGPYVAGVYAPETGAPRPFKTFLGGWTMGLFGGMGAECVGCGPPGAPVLLNVGTRKFFFEMLTQAYGNLACQPTGNPVGVGDGTGNGNGAAFVNFMNLRSSNPMRSGEARIAFGVAKSEKVQVRVYDVTGRLVKTVADRMFVGGQEHVVIWDGTNEMGERVKSGVYFYQLKTPHWTSQKKLAVLAN